MLKLAWRYMVYYKNQTVAILFSIILTAGLFSGISSLLYSSKMNDLEKNKLIYGDWHYKIAVNEEQLEKMNTVEHRRGYLLQDCGKLEIRDAVEEPYRILFEYADDRYRKLLHREIIEGKYPVGGNEIAADNYTLGNLGFTGGVGDKIAIGQNEYIVTGIVKSEWAPNIDNMELFVGEEFAKKMSYYYAYINFGTGEKLYKQLDNFLKINEIASDAVENNEEVTSFLCGEKPDSIRDIVDFGLNNKKGNITYIILKLQSEYNLAFNAMLMLLCIFSLFVIYSVFNISVSKRMSQYAVLQTVGIGEGTIFGSLTFELWVLFIIGYPAGVGMSIGLLNLLYNKLGKIFGSGNLISNTELQIKQSEQVIGNTALSSNFYIAWNAVIVGFVFLLIALSWIAFLTLRKIRKQSLNDIMKENVSTGMKKRKIYSTGHRSLLNVLIKRFMFSKRRKFVSILISLSLGGCIFLCTSYMVENLKIHAELSMKSDDGLNSEYKISLKTDKLSDSIPSSVVDNVKSFDDLEDVYATKYTLGEISIRKDELEWTDYFTERNNHYAFKRDYDGICVEKNNATYGIKYDVYGYEDELIESLNDYVLEGKIDMQSLEDHGVIAVANMDGQGNYDFYGKHPGDYIQLKVPKSKDCNKEVLKFNDSPDEYVVENLKIVAIVSRALIKEQGFLIRDPWKSAQSVIMTNQQMEDYFGINNYNIISASQKEKDKSVDVARKLLLAIKDVPRATLQDYSTAIETQKNYLKQQQLFFSGIAIIVLIISLFHIINSMNFSILARRHEFGIIRAMGITDAGFYKMIAKEGLLYGLLANMLMILVYATILKKIMIYYMQHVIKFLHITANVPTTLIITIIILNLVIALISVMVPARQIIKSNIISEIRE